MDSRRNEGVGPDRACPVSSAAKLRVFTSWKAPIDNGPAQLYRGCLADFIEYAPDMVFLVPHLQRGGADLGILHHVRLCAEMGVKVTVVVTRDVVSPWLNRLPAEVRVVEFGRLGNLLGEEDRRLVLLRLCCNVLPGVSTSSTRNWPGNCSSGMARR